HQAKCAEARRLRQFLAQASGLRAFRLMGLFQAIGGRMPGVEERSDLGFRDVADIARRETARLTVCGDVHAFVHLSSLREIELATGVGGQRSRSLQVCRVDLMGRMRGLQSPANLVPLLS